MKVYCFYLIDNRLDTKKYPGIDGGSNSIFSYGDDVITLYAFTPMKKIAKHFRQTRNMHLFKESIMHDVSREDYDRFCENHSDQILEYHEYLTEFLQDDKFISEKITILATRKESRHSIMCSWLVFNRILNENTVIFLLDLDYFKESIQENIRVWLFFDDIKESVNIKDLLKFTPLNIDMLAVHWYLFSNTYRKRCA